MTRRQEIENIIIGTILNNYCGEDYFSDCKSCITANMFSDERNRMIYNKAIEMRNAGHLNITPFDVVKYDTAMFELAPYMCELSVYWYFLSKKVDYNERQWLWSLSHDYKPRYTEVTFSDYVNRFIQIVFSS